jgi:hypothetical protein
MVNWSRCLAALLHWPLLLCRRLGCLWLSVRGR